MFIGHYGVALAIKKKEKRLPLWFLMLAVQWVDVMFFSFLLLGVESLRVVPGFTKYNNYDLYHMPYTHSLLGIILWSLAVGAFGYKKWGKKTFWWVTLAVFSHFILDVITHTPDMPLTFSSDFKMGLGMWNYLYLSLFSELVVFGFGYWWLGWFKNKRYLVFGAVLLAVLLSTPFMPLPSGPTEIGLSALMAYFGFAGLAYWVEKDQ